MRSYFRYWWLAMRPKTLPASISPILLGSALAASEGSLHAGIAITAIFCALFLQISVNLANDLFDGLSGVDTEERLGPARMVQSGFIAVPHMVIGLTICTILATLTGLFLAYHTNWQLLYIGLFCILAVFAYSAGPWPLASLGLGEIAVLIFFGWVAVMGSYFLQTETLSWQAWWYGTAAGLLNVAIMLVNNLRDIPTDQASGKLTLAVRLGDNNTRKLYQLLLILAMASHLLASWGDLWTGIVPLLICTPYIKIKINEIQKHTGRDLNQMIPGTAKLLLIYCITSVIFLFLNSG